MISHEKELSFGATPTVFHICLKIPFCALIGSSQLGAMGGLSSCFCFLTRALYNALVLNIKREVLFVLPLCACGQLHL